MNSIIQVIEHSDHIEIKVVGRIDEHANILGVVVPEAKKYIFDFENISAANSMGLRNWVLWTKKIKKNIPKVYKNCPKLIVDQLNILDGFLPDGGVIESFFVPYFCEKCLHEENCLVQRNKHFHEATADQMEWVAIESHRKCPKCDSEMDLDVVPSKYFSFLK